MSSIDLYDDDEIKQRYKYDENTISGTIRDGYNKIVYGKSKHDIKMENDRKYIEYLCEKTSNKKTWFGNNTEIIQNYKQCVKTYDDGLENLRRNGFSLKP